MVSADGKKHPTDAARWPEIDHRVLGAQSKHVVCIDSLFSYTASSRAAN